MLTSIFGILIPRSAYALLPATTIRCIFTSECTFVNLISDSDSNRRSNFVVTINARVLNVSVSQIIAP